MNLPHDWIRPQWPAPARVRSLITTRNGGHSTGAFATPFRVAAPSEKSGAGWPTAGPCSGGCSCAAAAPAPAAAKEEKTDTPAV